MIYGVGELLCDIVVDEVDGEAVVVDCRGGGTAWNVLANAADAGGKCRAFGVKGADWRGLIAQTDLVRLSVDARIEAQPRKLTQAIWQQRRRAAGMIEGGEWQLSPQCPACDRAIPASRLAALPTNAAQRIECLSDDILVVDRASAARIDSARAARRSGATTVLDLGHRGFVRFLDPHRLRDNLRQFDLIQSPQSVASTIAKRLGVPLSELASVVGCAFWIETDGPNGVIVRRGVATSSPEHVPAPAVEVVDPVGAGDALLGGVLAALQVDGADVRSIRLDDMAEAVARSSARLPAVIGSVGARAHLRPASHRANGDIMGRSLSGLKTEAETGAVCPACGSVAAAPSRPRRLGSRSNVNHLDRRVVASLSAREAVDLASDWLRSSGTTVVCGTGGSYSVAVLVATLMNSTGGFAVAMHPADYLAVPPAADRLVAISYSGTNRDLELVVRHGVRSRLARVGIVTMNPTPSVSDVGTMDERVEVISYGSPRLAPERGFVSIAATVMPAAIWVAAAHGVDAVLDGERPFDDRAAFGDMAAGLMDGTTTGSPIEVVATGWARAAALDFESKMTESAVAVARVHDTKDFSHGRFVSTLDTLHPRLLIGVGDVTDYEAKLASVLNRRGRLTHLRLTRLGALGAFDALLAVQHLTTLAAQSMGRDISRPTKIPEAGLALYRWLGDLP